MTQVTLDRLELFLESLREPNKNETKQELAAKANVALQEYIASPIQRPCNCDPSKRGGNHYSWCNSLIK